LFPLASACSAVIEMGPGPTSWTCLSSFWRVLRQGRNWIWYEMWYGQGMHWGSRSRALLYPGTDFLTLAKVKHITGRLWWELTKHHSPLILWPFPIKVKPALFPPLAGDSLTSSGNLQSLWYLLMALLPCPCWITFSHVLSRQPRIPSTSMWEWISCRVWKSTQKSSQFSKLLTFSFLVTCDLFWVVLGKYCPSWHVKFVEQIIYVSFVGKWFTIWYSGTCPLQVDLLLVFTFFFFL
jgi:hypothetical protein